MGKVTSKKNKISLRRKAITYYRRLKLLIKLSLLVFILLFFFTGLFDLKKKMIANEFYKITAKNGLVLENVVIEGQRNISYKDIIDSLEATERMPILAVDLWAVKKRLEENKWVEAVLIERKLPSTIYIAIKEREPIAIWQFQGKSYLIDSEGNRITNYEKQNFKNLLQVVGQDANIYAQNLLDELARYPEIQKRVKSAVRFGQRRWDLNFREDFIVKMPENSFSLAYDYLNSLNKNKKLFNQNYKLLDLRDSNKYYFEYHVQN